MSVSDNTASSGSAAHKHLKFRSGPGKRLQRPLSEDQWKNARIQFEAGDKGMTLARIASLFQTSISSVQKRSAAEKWSKGAQIVAEARNQLKLATTNALAQAAQENGAKVAKSLMDELQPWIEREKRSQIKRAISRSKRGMKRLDRVAKGYQVWDAKHSTTVDLETSPKDEMNIAAAEDKYDNIVRRNLGMGDNSTIGGTFSLNILANQAAIRVNPGSKQ